MSKLPSSSRLPAHAGRRARAAVACLPIALVVGALAPAHAEDWAQFQFNASRIGINGGETAFTPDSVRSLRVAGKARFGTNLTSGGTAIYQGRLFIGTADRRLSAFDLAQCSAGACEPLWQGNADGGFTSTPGVSGNTVAIAATDGFLYAFSAQGCGKAHCAPLWRGRLNGPSLDSSVTMVGGQIMVGDGAGQLSVFSLGGCGQDICDPLWIGRTGRPHEHDFGTPAVGAGFVFVQTTVDKPIVDGGRLLAFALGGCGQASCGPAWVADLGGPVGRVGSPILVHGNKVIVGTVPPPARGLVTRNRTQLLAFTATGCGTFVCQPVQTFEGRPDGFQVAAASNFGGTTLFVTASPDLAARGTASVLAYDLVHCGAHCEPTWTSTIHGEITFSPPAVAGDVVFVGKGTSSLADGGAGVLAFDARGCGKARCEPLTFVPSSPQAAYFGQPLAIADGKVAFVENDNADFSSNVAIMSLP
jgi:outer membrane protein assembly factor BamB